MQESSLREVFDRHGCLKGAWHSYERVYDPFWAEHQLDHLRILEVGIFKGASIFCWLDAFPNAQVYGIDTFERVQPDGISCLSDDRVCYWAGRSQDFQLPEGWPANFDLIIDDGKHTPEAQAATFDRLFPYLSDTGVYFIEDVWPYDALSYHAPYYNDRWQFWPDKHKGECTPERYAVLTSAVQGNRVVHHDLRRGQAPSSYVIEVRRCSPS